MPPPPKPRGRAPIKDPDKYNLEARVERALAALVVTKSSAWGACGKSMKPDLLPSEEGQVLFKLAHLAAGTGDAAGWPGGLPLIYQAADVLVAEGLEDERKVHSALAWVEHGFGDLETGSLNERAVLRAGVGAVRKLGQDVAANKMLQGWSKGLDVSKAVDEYKRAMTIGENEDRGTQVLSVKDRLRVLHEVQKADPLPTGVIGLDVGLGGGLTRGNIGLIAGGPGDGKSSTVTQFCAYTAGVLMRTSAIASCELRERQNILKFEAALWGKQINAIKANPSIIDDCYARRGDLVAPFFFRHYELKRGRPTIQSVFDWLDECEQASGRKIEMLGLDHFDRFDPSDGKTHSDYAKGEAVYDELAQHTFDRGMYTWAPSQCVRKRSGALWGPGDMAHSQHKEKRADAVFSVTAGGKPGARTMTWWLFKNREGEANVIIGPEPVGFAYGMAIEVPILAEVDPMYAELL